MTVLPIEAWPIQSCTKRRSAPASSRWVAIECLSAWKWPLALRNGGLLAVVLHQFIQSAAADRGVVAGQKQGGRGAVPLFEIGFDGFEFVRLQRVQARQGVLQAVNPEAVLCEVKVGGAQHPYLRSFEAVAVGQQEEGIIAFGVNRIQQAAQFILRQEVDAGRCPAFRV